VTNKNIVSNINFPHTIEFLAASPTDDSNRGIMSDQGASRERDVIPKPDVCGIGDANIGIDAAVAPDGKKPPVPAQKFRILISSWVTDSHPQRPCPTMPDCHPADNLLYRL
jgi:hypothetical protein